MSIPAGHSKYVDDRLLKQVTRKCPKRLLSLQLCSCHNISTFTIMKVLLSNKQLQEVSIKMCLLLLLVLSLQQLCNSSATALRQLCNSSKQYEFDLGMYKVSMMAAGDPAAVPSSCRSQLGLVSANSAVSSYAPTEKTHYLQQLSHEYPCGAP